MGIFSLYVVENCSIRSLTNFTIPSKLKTHVIFNILDYCPFLCCFPGRLLFLLFSSHLTGILLVSVVVGFFLLLLRILFFLSEKLRFYLF